VPLRYEPFDKLRANGVSRQSGRADASKPGKPSKTEAPVRAEPVEGLVTVPLRYEPFDKLRANGVPRQSGRADASKPGEPSRWKVPVQAEPVEAFVTALLRYEPFDSSGRTESLHLRSG